MLRRSRRAFVSFRSLEQILCSRLTVLGAQKMISQREYLTSKLSLGSSAFYPSPCFSRDKPENLEFSFLRDRPRNQTPPRHANPTQNVTPTFPACLRKRLGAFHADFIRKHPPHTSGKTCYSQGAKETRNTQTYDLAGFLHLAQLQSSLLLVQSHFCMCVCMLLPLETSV